MKTIPKWTWFSKGIAARKNQVIIIVKTRTPAYSEHLTQEPSPLLPAYTTTDPTKLEEPPSVNHERISKEITKSIPTAQKPTTTIPLRTLREQCYGVIIDSNRKDHPLELRVGDILVVHDHEGFVLKSGGVSGIVMELTDM